MAFPNHFYEPGMEIMKRMEKIFLKAAISEIFWVLA
jgi:hypothetical protein